MVQRTKEERVTDAHTDADERQNFQRRLMRHALLGGFKALNLLMHAAVFALSWQATQSGYGASGGDEHNADGVFRRGALRRI